MLASLLLTGTGHSRSSIYFNYNAFLAFNHLYRCTALIGSFQDSIGELLNKVTTSTFLEEGEAYRLLKGKADRICLILALMGIEGVVKRFRDVLAQAEELVRESASVPVKDRRPVT